MAQAPHDPSEAQRRRLQREAVLGFLGTFTAIALIIAVINVFRADPSPLPAVIAGLLLLITLPLWHRHRKSTAHDVTMNATEPEQKNA